MILLFIPFLFGASYYLSYRLHGGLVSFFPKLRFLPVIITVIALLIIVIVGFARALIPFPDGVKHILGILSGYLMGFLMYFLMFTVAAEIIFALPRILKPSFALSRYFNGAVMASVLLISLVTCIAGFINAGNIKHVSYDVQLYGKKDISDMNIVMISDLHLGAIGSEERLEKTVSEINKEKPDIICIAGDFFDTDFASVRDPEKALESLKKLSAKYGIYACLGNHDGGSTHEKMTEFLDKAGITLLADTYTVVDDRLIIVGRLDGSAIGGYGDKERHPFSEVFDVEETSLPVIVLDHNPVNIDEYSTESDIILCGHTHRGQVFPANLVTKAVYTVDYGYFKKDESSPHVIVSSGVGTWGMPMRVGTNCEIVKINITNGN